MTIRTGVTGKHLLYAFALVIFLFWIGESLFEFIWFNPEGTSFISQLVPLHDSHEMFMRITTSFTFLVCGFVVSRMYTNLADSESQARESENNLRITFDSIGDAVIATDVEGNIVRMNPVAETLTGWDFAQAEGSALTDVVKMMNSSTKGLSDNPLEGVLRDGEARGLSNHTILISKQGKKFHIADSAAPIRRDDGEMSGAVFVFRNVTERYKNEAELRSLRNYLFNIIDSMPSVLLGVSGDGQVTLWNRAAEQATGISAEVAQDKKLLEIFPRMEKEMGRIFESIRSKEISREQKKIRHSETGVCYEDVTIFPLASNGAEGAEGAVVRIDDVTELIRLEQAMIQNEKMMSVGGLAAGMAHEINNPLAAILGHTQNINNRVFGDLEKNEEIALACDVSLHKVREYLEKRGVPRMLDGIYSSSSHAAKIVSDMIRFSRKTESNMGRHHLSELLEDTLELAANDYDLKMHYDFRKIEIVREYDNTVPSLYCEGSEIQQVFLNILKNGAQSMMEKEYRGEHPRFILRVRKEEDVAVVEIEDNGLGMDENVIKRIFEPFYSTKKLGRSSGLGLSVSYFVVTDQHNGSMEAHSLPGSWARFIIKLPLAVEV
ncbi:PAS domain S-box protein [Maridesulfovibrio ferrireducens]|uniref:PAS domain-containing sensor histidine kinase n=1 Tax=Maridesulfovibrio ferrireducens TaxID=246191 RepID=UPI001A236948|nr:PAS domain S-box protein [Maridesulfovibrio ferrireducens]MBI9111735.1 PAS domain S-box protein [Maridesulfovibrio ferrireducens]